METQIRVQLHAEDGSVFNLELLENGGFKINQLEFDGLELRPFRINGAEISRTTSPESVLRMCAGQNKWSFHYNKGTWQAGRLDALNGTKPRLDLGTMPSQPECSAVNEPHVGEPPLLESEPSRNGSLLVEHQYKVRGCGASKAQLLICHFYRNLAKSAPPGSECGRSRFADEVSGQNVIVLYKVIWPNFHTMYVVKARFIPCGDSCDVILTGSYECSQQGWEKSRTAAKSSVLENFLNFPPLVIITLFSSTIIADRILKPARFDRRMREIEAEEHPLRREAAKAYCRALRDLGSFSRNGYYYNGVMKRRLSDGVEESRFDIGNDDRSEILRWCLLAREALYQACHELDLNEVV